MGIEASVLLNLLMKALKVESFKGLKTFNISKILLLQVFISITGCTVSSNILQTPKATSLYLHEKKLFPLRKMFLGDEMKIKLSNDALAIFGCYIMRKARHPFSHRLLSFTSKLYPILRAWKKYSWALFEAIHFISISPPTQYETLNAVSSLSRMCWHVIDDAQFVIHALFLFKWRVKREKWSTINWLMTRAIYHLQVISEMNASKHFERKF